IRYKKALEEALKEKIEEMKKKGSNEDIKALEKIKVEVVISGPPDDDPEYQPYTDERKHDRIIQSFKLPFDRTGEDGISGDVCILVVQSMLITGFDAPVEQVMYLDNVIKGHNLLQAIARVNRVYKNKTCGFVVDYVGVLKHLRESLSIYADEDIEEIAQVVKDKAQSIDELRYISCQIDDFFKKNHIKNWRDDLNACIDLLVDEETRNEFIMLVRRFNKVMDAVLPDPEGLKYAADLKILNFIKESARNRYRDVRLSIRDASRKIREIVEEYLVSKGVDPKIPPTPLFDDNFMEKVKKQRSSKAKAQELKYAIVEHINTHFEEDPEFYERFSDLLNRILREYKENWEILALELEKIRESMKRGRSAEETFGFDPRKEMPFFGLLKREMFGKKPIEKLSKKDIDFLVDLTKDVIEITKREIKVVDFWENYTKQRQLKSYIISRLLISVQPSNKTQPPEMIYMASESSEPYVTGIKKTWFKKRNEIAQKLIELAYHIYGEK
ncbi:MAG: type I restriction enzyme endonuclease domain-containing protein, partial [Acetomicrobium sp.]